MCRIIDQNIKKCLFHSLDFQNFPEKHARDPLEKRGLRPRNDRFAIIV